jgi:hypothetical protein
VLKKSEQKIEDQSRFNLALNDQTLGCAFGPPVRRLLDPGSFGRSCVLCLLLMCMLCDFSWRSVDAMHFSPKRLLSPSFS